MPFLPCAWPRALVCRFHKRWLRLRRPSPDPLGVAQVRSVCAICFEGMCELPHTPREGFEIDRRTNAFAKKVENHAWASRSCHVSCNFVGIHQTLKVTPGGRWRD